MLLHSCQCGNRLAAYCPGEYEPGCDLGASDKHAVQASPALHDALKQAIGLSRAEVNSVRRSVVARPEDVEALCDMADELFDLREKIARAKDALYGG